MIFLSPRENGRPGEAAASTGTDGTDEGSSVVPLSAAPKGGAMGTRCDNVASAAVRSFSGVIRRRLRRRPDGGVFTERDLDACLAEFMMDPVAQSVFAVERRRCCKRAEERAALQTRRRNYFGRLLVEPIAPLLHPPGLPPSGAVGIDRRVLPGLFRFVDDRLGGGIVLSRNDRCRAVFEELSERHGTLGGWELFTAHPQSRVILAETLADLAAALAAVPEDGLRDFLRLVEEEGGWTASCAEASLLMQAWFRDMAEGVLAPPGRKDGAIADAVAAIAAIDGFRER